MKKWKVLIWLLCTLFLLSGCYVPTKLEQIQECKSQWNWRVYWLLQWYGSESCHEKFSFCSWNCSKSIDRSLANINDTRWNKWWFPDAVTEQLNQCIEMCQKSI